VKMIVKMVTLAIWCTRTFRLIFIYYATTL